MTTIEAVFVGIVVIVCLVWDALIIYQIWRGETFALSTQTYEALRTWLRKTEPAHFGRLLAFNRFFLMGALFIYYIG